jgi:hypothetical protein
MTGALWGLNFFAAAPHQQRQEQAAAGQRQQEQPMHTAANGKYSLIPRAPFMDRHDLVNHRPAAPGEETSSTFKKRGRTHASSGTNDDITLSQTALSHVATRQQPNTLPQNTMKPSIDSAILMAMMAASRRAESSPSFMFSPAQLQQQQQGFHHGLLPQHEETTLRDVKSKVDNLSIRLFEPNKRFKSTGKTTKDAL